MIIVTSRKDPIDIDSLASALAYQELLNSLGQKAKAVLTGTWNNTVTPTIRALDLPYDTSVTVDSDMRFVLVDTSAPEQFPDFVHIDQVSEVLDHHSGFESFWQEKIGSGAIIEHIGASATLVWEKIKKAQKESEISHQAIQLLCYAIVSNTLNFKSKMTIQRDHEAFRELAPLAHLADNWIEKYYKEQDALVFKDIAKAITSDAYEKECSYCKGKVVIAQIEMWQGKPLVSQNEESIKNSMNTFSNTHWFVTIPSIADNHNYFIAGSDTVQRMLHEAFGVVFNNAIARTDSLILRKEIMKQLKELAFII